MILGLGRRKLHWVIVIVIVGGFFLSVWKYTSSKNVTERTVTNPIENKPLACGLFPLQEVVNFVDRPLSEIGEFFPGAGELDGREVQLWDDIPGTCRIRYFDKEKQEEFLYASIRYDFIGSKERPEYPPADDTYFLVKNDKNKVYLPRDIGEGYYSSKYGAHFTLPCVGKDGPLYVQLAYGEEVQASALAKALPLLAILSDSLRKHPDCQ